MSAASLQLFKCGQETMFGFWRDEADPRPTTEAIQAIFIAYMRLGGMGKISAKTGIVVIIEDSPDNALVVVNAEPEHVYAHFLRFKGLCRNCIECDGPLEMYEFRAVFAYQRPPRCEPVIPKPVYHGTMQTLYEQSTARIRGSGTTYVVDGMSAGAPVSGGEMMPITLSIKKSPDSGFRPESLPAANDCCCVVS